MNWLDVPESLYDRLMAQQRHVHIFELGEMYDKLLYLFRELHGRQSE